MLSKEQIFAADDLRSVVVHVPEWGGDIKLQTMTGAQRDSYEQMLYRTRQGEEIKNLRASLVAFCAVNEDGTPMFTAKDIEALGKKSAAVLGRLFDRAQEINALTDEDLEAEKGN